MGVLTTFLAFAIIMVSGYCLHHSAQSIPKLQQYERKVEKAAEWSNIAEKRLWDTRYTVGAGFVMTSISLLTAISHLFFTPTHPTFFNAMGAIIWTSLLAVGELAAASYMKSFWSAKRKIPLPSMSDYNDAISNTEKVMGLSEVLGAGWGVFAVLLVLRGLGMGF